MTDTPTDRAALEACATDLEWIERKAIFDQIGDHQRMRDIAATLRALASRDIAATLRALASRAEPPADVAGLVEEARHWEAALTARADRIGEGLKRPGVVDRFEEEAHHQELATSSHLIARLAAALTAQAERIQELEVELALEQPLRRELAERHNGLLARAEKAEGLNKEAGDGCERIAKIIKGDLYRMREKVEDAEHIARALAAKLKGEG